MISTSIKFTSHHKLLHYNLYQPNSSPSTTTAIYLFIHGAGLNSNAWVSVIEEYTKINTSKSEKSIYLAMDLPNHGLSENDISLPSSDKKIILPEFVIPQTDNNTMIANCYQQHIISRLNNMESPVFISMRNAVVSLLENYFTINILELSDLLINKNIKLYGIGHSMGSIPLLQLSSMYARLFTKLCLHEPIVMDPVFENFEYYTPTLLTLLSPILSNKQFSIKNNKILHRKSRSNTNLSYYNQIVENIHDINKINEYIKQLNLSSLDDTEKELLYDILAPIPKYLTIDSITKLLEKVVLPIELLCSLQIPTSAVRVLKRKEEWSNFEDAYLELKKKSAIYNFDPRSRDAMISSLTRQQNGSISMYPSNLNESTFYGSFHTLIASNVKVEIPVLLTLGENSFFALSPGLYPNFISKALPFGELKIVDGDHSFPFCKPNELAKILYNFNNNNSKSNL